MNRAYTAAHLMWLERQLERHQRWQQGLIVAWGVSLAGTAVLFLLVLPFLRSVLPLPEEVTLITAGGVAVELLALLLIILRVVLRRRALAAEIERIARAE